jgi:hypothetical protein
MASENKANKPGCCHHHHHPRGITRDEKIKTFLIMV